MQKVEGSNPFSRSLPVSGSCFSSWLLHKAISEKLLRDRGDGSESGWL